MKTYEQLKATPVEKLNRTEVIEALRYTAHPSTFHSLLGWSTAHLKALLAYYREDDKQPRLIKKPTDTRSALEITVEIARAHKCACGAPWAHTGKHWPHLQPAEKRTMRDRIFGRG